MSEFSFIQNGLILVDKVNIYLITHSLYCSWMTSSTHHHNHVCYILEINTHYLLMNSNNFKICCWNDDLKMIIILYCIHKSHYYPLNRWHLILFMWSTYILSSNSACSLLFPLNNQAKECFLLFQTHLCSHTWWVFASAREQQYMNQE